MNLSVSHLGREKVKLHFNFTIKSLVNPPSSAKGKSLMVAWKRGDNNKGETKAVEYNGEQKILFGEDFTLYLSFYMDTKTQKFDPKSLGFALYEVNGKKKNVIAKAEINVSDYGKDGFDAGRAVCLGKNAQKDPTLEVYFKTTWEKIGAKKLVAPDSTSSKPKVNINGRDYQLESSIDRTNVEDPTNLDFSDDERSSGSSKGKPKSPTPAPEEKTTLDVLSTAITGKERAKLIFRVTVLSFNNLSPSEQGSKIYMKWKRASKEGHYGDTKKYECRDGTIPVDEAFEVECTMLRDKKGKFTKKMIALQLRSVSGGQDTELVKFDIDLAPFAEEGESYEYTAKKSDRFPSVSMAIAARPKGARANPTDGRQRNQSEVDVQTDLHIDSDHDEDPFAENSPPKSKQFDPTPAKKETSYSSSPTSTTSSSSSASSVPTSSSSAAKFKKDEPEDELSFTKYVGKTMVEYNSSAYKKIPDYSFKVIMIGDSGVGKTNVLNRYNGGKFESSTVSTIGVNLFSKVYVRNADSKVINLGVWDTAGQERFKSITKSYYRGANGVVLVYDVTDRRSFDHLTNWVSEVKESNPSYMTWLVIGNKADLDREVPTAEATRFAQSINAAFMETSALQNSNIHEAFEVLVTALLESVSKSLLTSTMPSLPSTSSLPLATPSEKQQDSCPC
eukprot:TRINITY_DN2900_c0_g1_i2.p1 TRINITY_DN2900_c0_g1~~TRINITY_DN2900_c0_g1_i2.p1  ORF type:complete len:673 (-),score=186.12 TRINITY_DN2900_c0_g1_i2:155-2173(-)